MNKDIITPTKMDRFAFLRKFRHANEMSDEDLSSLDLSTNMSYRTIRDSNMRNALITGSIYDNIKLINVNMEGIAINHAKLHESTMVDAVMNHSRISDTDLRGTIMQDSIIDDSILYRVSTHDSTYPGTA